MIINALSLHQLDLISYHSSDIRAVAARQNSCNQWAFICHRNDHWFTLRKIGSKWHNLNSLFDSAQEIGDDGAHISYFATQQQIEEYTGIFLITEKLNEDKQESPQTPFFIQSDCSKSLSEVMAMDMDEKPCDTYILKSNTKNSKKRKSTLGRKNHVLKWSGKKSF